jgi:hypothetical protein
MPAKCQWSHNAGAALGVEVPRALATVGATGRAGDVATWRAFVLGVVASTADLGPTPVAIDGTDLVVRPTLDSRRDRATWQRAIAYGLAALVAPKDATTPPELVGESVNVTTIGGEPATLTRPGNVEAFPLAAIAAVVVVYGIVAAAVAYSVAVVAEKDLRAMEGDFKREALAKTLAESAAMVEAHVDRETREKRSIAWAEGELARLEALNRATEAASGWKPDPLASVANLRGLSDDAGRALKAASSGLSWALPIALILGTYLLAEK